MSNTHILATLDKLGQNHDLDLAKSKERICQQMNCLKQAQAMHSMLLVTACFPWDLHIRLS
jgi:hypothetical protein